jgi:hypothetical protein
MVMIRRLMAAAMVSAFASGTTMAASTPALKPIDPAALQAAIEGLSKELMLPDGKPTANTLMVKILDEIYAVSPLQQAK